MARSEVEDMVRNSPIGATVIDCETGRLIMANNAFLNIIGIESEELFLKMDRSRTWGDLDEYNFAMNCIMEQRELVNFETRRRRSDGEMRKILINSQSVILYKKPVYIIWQFDVTDQKEAEKSAAENEENFRIIFESSPIATGIARERDSKILMANRSYADLLGYDLEEMRRKPVRETWAFPEEREYIAELYEKQGYVSRELIRGRHKDGSILWLSISWMKFTYHGDACHLFWAYDLTQQKETEVELTFAREEAMQATQAKSAFLASMSHEIRTPLNGVLGLAELLQSSNLDELQQERLSSILETGQSLLGVINDILDISKIESGNLELEDTAIDLEDLIKSFIPTTNALAEQKSLIYNSNIRLDEKLPVRGDATRIRQIIWNLLSNAVKFTEHGLVSLTVEKLTPELVPPHVTVAQKDVCVRFEVKDTGIGIARGRLANIFDPFIQADTTITRKHGGTGLGLSIVKKLVELMGGAITVQSQEGSGSLFAVYLPFDAADEDIQQIQPSDTKPAPDVDDTSDTSYQITVVEDNPVNAYIVTAFLEAEGHQVRVLENGLRAVEAANDQWADLYLMDVHMPEMNGMEATSAIRDMGITVPIIGVTADAFTDRLDHFTQAGMDTVLTKPYKSEQLHEIIHYYMAQQPHAAQQML
ncbi:PAS domain-containing hybrid sensor histidine kinase/response regulator [Sneathiella glossodoripedis]|uniref:PAS domain-containing hybrid sensor histidine kinase/response regulator n=1 Tax=Sneathiella glossodoripedis TaxID=418853 RepID=UPI000472E675|nr:PAS domain-containing hybrid sensor histidine kinase/response regulator [Sneathiella glossodoripedis]